MSSKTFDFTTRSSTAVSAGELSGLLGGNLHTRIASGTTSLPLAQLQAFEGHTYSVINDAEMQELSQSIRDNGVLTPLYVRPHGNGYEIISGHRRAYAATMAGLFLVPCIVEEMDDDTAAVRMVETNRYRERILPSERARSYKLAADALNRQGRRSDLYGSDEEQPTLQQVTGESERNVRNWIRLTYLLKALLDRVDAGTLPARAGVELSYLFPREQEAVERYLTETGKKLTVAQAQSLHRYSVELDSGEHGTMTLQGVYRTVCGDKPEPVVSILKFKKPELQRIGDYIPISCRGEEATNYIISALEYYNDNKIE